MSNSNNSNNLIVSIWFALKRCLVLIIALVLLGTSCGIVYGFTKKPNYTAKEEVVLTVEDNDNGNIVINFNIMVAYINTIVDFCDEGVVVDRANFYYVLYQQRTQPGSSFMQDGGYSVSEFIEDIETMEDPYSTEETAIVNRDYILKENVYVSEQVETQEQDVFAFTIGYTDPDLEQAKIKSKIYVMAFMREIQPAADKVGVKYFDGLNIVITRLSKENSNDNSNVTSDVSKVKCALIGFLVGAVLAAIATYIVSVTDVTVKSREDVEELTGSAVLAFIEDEGGVR